MAMFDLTAPRGESSPRRLQRRTLLRIGGLAPLGLSLPGLLAAESRAGGEARGPLFGRAKRCLLLFMWGGPAHQDTFDLKPDAPAEVRGEFRPIATNVPGVNVCEHLPHLARHMDKLALIRSVTHSDNNHSTGAHWMLTGYQHRLSAENFGASSSDHPHIGSVLAKLLPSDAPLPAFVALPEIIATTAGAVVPGQFGGKLGAKFDPLVIAEHPNKPTFAPPGLALPAEIDPARIAARQDLRQAFNNARQRLHELPQVAALGEHFQRAADLVAGDEARTAFDLTREPAAQRERYGSGVFGQSLLLARRLLESGVRLVTVYWHRDQPGVDTTWDTHAQNFQQLKDRLLPQVDQPLATLLEDLSQRGLLDDTLVVWTSEFGRTPKINGNAGRDHWGACNSIWLAGGGVPGGQVYGASDARAAYPTRDPVAPGDVAATIFHLLGVDPTGWVHDREDRPHHVAQGRPVAALLRGAAAPYDAPPAEPEPPATVAPSPEIVADRPLGYWLLNDTTGSLGPAVPSDQGEAPAGRYLGDVARGDQRLEVELPGWSRDSYTVEICVRNTRPHDAAAVTGYFLSRPGADVGADRDRGEHVGIGGSYRLGGDLRGRLIVFNGVDDASGLLVGRTVVPLDTWLHVVLTRDGRRVRVYLNGQTDRPEIDGELTPTHTTDRLRAATRSDDMFPLAGQVRHLAVFHGVLPAERIAAHHRASPAARG